MSATPCYARDHGTHRRILELSKGLWNEIQQSHNETLDRLALGEDGEHWGVMSFSVVGSSWVQPFQDTNFSFESHLHGQTRKVSSLDAVKFVSFGGFGDWAFNVNGNVLYSGPESFKKAMREAKAQGREVVV